jgi:hypothetical protein
VWISKAVELAVAESAVGFTLSLSLPVSESSLLLLLLLLNFAKDRAGYGTLPQ